MLLGVWLLLLTFTQALNIVLTTTDNWANSNVRSLYYELSKQNHQVLQAGPLYDQQLVDEYGRELEISAEDYDEDEDEDSVGNWMRDGGAYGHLQRVNQLYHFKLQALADSTKLPNVPKMLHKVAPVPMTNLSEFENTAQFGYDPLDSNHWYINSKNPKNVLSIFLDNIIPNFYKGFVPDLVIVVSASGSKGNLEAVQQISMINELPTMTVDLTDMNRIYYLHESLNSPKSRGNRVSSFINNKIITVVNKLKAHAKTDRALMPLYHCIDLKFPEYTNSKCKLKSSFKFSQFQQLPGTKFSEFALIGNELTKSNTNMVRNKGSEPQKSSDVDQSILEGCDIAVSVNYLFKQDKSADFKELVGEL